jgi:hypothetical protein
MPSLLLRPIRPAWVLLALLAVVASVASVLLWPPPYEKEARGKRWIDIALPRYQFAERHQTRVCAPADRILAGIKQVSPSEIRLVDLLTAIRGLTFQDEKRPILELALESDFILLADTPTELVLGAAGEFWRDRLLHQELADARGKPDAFARLDVKGLPKAVTNLVIEPAPFGCQYVTTETRIYAGDPAMRRKFAAYWRVIQPGSALLRRTWLDAIRRRAEAK